MPPMLQSRNKETANSDNVRWISGLSAVQPSQTNAGQSLRKVRDIQFCLLLKQQGSTARRPKQLEKC